MVIKDKAKLSCTCIYDFDYTVIPYSHKRIIKHVSGFERFYF